jgi:2-isopropylmalate synthase
MKHKLKKNPDEVLKMAVEAVRYARTFTDNVEFSPEDACRSEIPFLCEILAAVIEAGATTLNIPDTVGYVLPYEYGRIIAELKEKVRGAEKAIFSTHCHNDLGMAVANSLAGVRNGARQVECTINGIGERGHRVDGGVILSARDRTSSAVGQGRTPTTITKEFSARAEAFRPAVDGCFRSSRTRLSSAPTLSPTSRASTSTACRRTGSNA